MLQPHNRYVKQLLLSPCELHTQLCVPPWTYNSSNSGPLMLLESCISSENMFYIAIIVSQLLCPYLPKLRSKRDTVGVNSVESGTGIHREAIKKCPLEFLRCWDLILSSWISLRSYAPLGHYQCFFRFIELFVFFRHAFGHLHFMYSSRNHPQKNFIIWDPAMLHWRAEYLILKCRLCFKCLFGKTTTNETDMEIETQNWDSSLLGSLIVFYLVLSQRPMKPALRSIALRRRRTTHAFLCILARGSAKNVTPSVFGCFFFVGDWHSKQLLLCSWGTHDRSQSTFKVCFEQLVTCVSFWPNHDEHTRSYGSWIWVHRRQNSIVSMTGYRAGEKIVGD